MISPPAALPAFKHLRPYVRPSDYFGATWYGWYPVLGQSRDSGHVEASNFAVAWEGLELLQRECNSPDDELNGETAPFYTVVRTCCNHWAVGWVETIYVHGSNRAALERADEILEALSDYPVLSDEDLSRREGEAATEYWARESVRGRARILRECRSGVSLFAARRDELPQDDCGRVFEYCRGD